MEQKNIQSGDIHLSSQLEGIFTTEKNIAEQIHQGGVRQQRKVVKKISEILNFQYAQKELLEKICMHLVRNGDVQSAITYVDMYIDDGDMDSDILASILHEIAKKAYSAENGNGDSVTAPKGLFRVVHKLDKTDTNDVKGVLSLVQGQIVQIFGGNKEEVIAKYRQALDRNHPNAYFLLGHALIGNDMYEEGLSVFLLGWEKNSDQSCLREYVRYVFKYGNKQEAHRYYRILREIDQNAPHIIQLLPEIILPDSLSIVMDYVEKIHFQEVNELPPGGFFINLTQWVGARMYRIDDEREITRSLIVEHEQNGEDISQYEEEYERLTLEVLGLMQFGAIGLLDKPIALNYLKNIESLMKMGEKGREVLDEHIIHTKPYARAWIEKIQNNSANSTEDDSDNDSVDKTEGYYYLQRFQQGESVEESDNQIVDEIMGILDMVLYHFSTRNDKDIVELYQRIMNNIADDPETVEHLNEHMKDTSIEMGVFDSMPKNLRDWYEQLGVSLEQEDGGFMRRKIEGAHRSGGPLVQSKPTNNIVLFSFIDSFVTGSDQNMAGEISLLEKYSKQIEDLDLSPDEALNLCNVCFYFQEYDLASDFLLGGVVDWKNPETIFLALRLVYKITKGFTGETGILVEKIEDGIIGEIEECIRQQGIEIESLGQFISTFSSQNGNQDESQEENPILSEITGLEAYLSGDLEGATSCLEKSHNLGSDTALIHLSNIYLLEGDKKQAYIYMKQAYDSKKIESLLDISYLTRLVIETGNRTEAYNLIEYMKERNADELLEMEIQYLITGNEEENIEAIRLICTYGPEVIETFSTGLMTMIQERMTVMLRNEESSSYEKLSCLKTIALSTEKNIQNAIKYWQFFGESIGRDDIMNVCDHLEIDQDATSSLEEGEKGKESLSDKIQIEIVAEASLFRSQFEKDVDFPVLADAIIKTFNLFPETSELAKNWAQEINGIVTPRHAFELGYDFGNFGKKPTIQ